MGVTVQVDDAGITCGDAKYFFRNMDLIKISFREALQSNDTNIEVELMYKNTCLESLTLEKNSIDFARRVADSARKQGVKVESILDTMSICPTCGKRVANNAISCPSCGYVFAQNQPKVQAQPSSNGGGLGFGGTILAVIIAIVIVGFVG